MKLNRPMSEVGNRLKNHMAPPSAPKPHLEWVGESPTAEDGKPELPRKMQRDIERKQKALARRTVMVPVGEADIPAGSVLSDRTLAMIREGHVAMAVTLPPTPRDKTIRRPSKRTPSDIRRLERRKRDREAMYASFGIKDVAR